jgi:hypothetical protein
MHEAGENHDRVLRELEDEFDLREMVVESRQ